MKQILRLAPRDWIGLTIVLAGLILRLRQYLVNRSLWLDEAMLSINIVERSYGGLTGWLTYDQQAPIGFLWLQKTAVLVFGNNEYALRLTPFLAGCAALFLMYALSRRLPPISGNAALALFIVSSALIYYSSEAKQYIFDVAVSLGLLALWLHFEERGIKPREHVLLGALGAFAIWFSHPAVFTLAAIGLLSLLKALRQKSALGWTLLAGGFWLASFAAFYFLFLRRSVHADVLLDYWGDAFLPLSSRAETWLTFAFDNFFVSAAGLETPLLLNAALALIGGIALARRDARLATALTLPFLLTLAASALHAYPFAGRMTLFLVPAGFILIGEGVQAFGLLLKKRPRASAWIVSVLAIALVAGNARASAQNFAAPKLREHLRPTMEYLRNARKPGDSFYIYYWAEPAFSYYAPKYGLFLPNTVFGTEHHAQPELYFSELDALRGRERVWVLFSHVYEENGFNERDYILSYLDSIGKLSRQFREPGTSVYLYLYDLR